MLSPYLFAIFVDDLLIKIRNSKLGCNISGICLNAVMYADDLLLMSISVSDLQKLVDLCIKEFDEIGMLINIKKSVCIRIGQRHNSSVGCIDIQSQSMDWKSELRYLGVYFVSSNTIKCNLQIIRQKIFRALNGIFGKIGARASPMIIISLIDSFCVPILSYGIEAFKVTGAMFSSLEAAYTAAFAKIFWTFDKAIIRNCQFYSGTLPLCYKIDVKRLQFFTDLTKSGNTSVCALFTKCGRTEYYQLLHKYSLSATVSVTYIKKHIWKFFSDSL